MITPFIPYAAIYSFGLTMAATGAIAAHRNGDTISLAVTLSGLVIMSGTLYLAVSDILERIV
jgi:hypothetical protein